MARRLLYGLLFSVGIFGGPPAMFLAGCRKDTPPQPPYVRSIELQALDASCTDAWLKISLTQPAADSVQLRRDGQTVQTLRLSTPDTLVVDTTLLPNRTYRYKAYRLNGSQILDSSTQVSLTAMDTTSHAFVFQIDTLGVTSSVLYDVAIVSDSNMWAVGELYLNESTRYNAAVWNGNTWTIIRVPYYYQGQPFYHPIQTVFAFGPDDIWFAGNGVIRWDGQQYVPMEIPSSVWGPNRINKIWGRSGNDLYIVGDNGSIAHYASGTWRRVESGTTIDLIDIWGTNGNTFWISGLDLTTGQRSVLLHYNSTMLRRAYEYDPVIQSRRPDSISGVIVSAWTASLYNVWVSTSTGVYVCPTTTRGEGRLSWAPPYLVGFLWKLRGSAKNNIFVGGDYGTIAHYNGATWHHYIQFMQLFDPSAPHFESLAVTDRLTTAVGTKSGKAVVLIGRR